MIVCDNVAYYPYLLILADAEPILGLDPRNLEEIQADWLKRWQEGARRAALQERSTALAIAKNERLMMRQEIRQEEGDPVLDRIKGEEKSLTLDDVSAPAAEVVEADEVLQLSGLPGTGYGALVIHASSVQGIARAWGEEADDFCAGVPTRYVKTRKPKKGKRSRPGMEDGGR